MNEQVVLDEIQKMIEAEGSQVRVARALKMSPSYLSEIISGDRGLSDPVLRKLGFERITVYTRIEDRRRMEKDIRTNVGGIK